MNPNTNGVQRKKRRHVGGMANYMQRDRLCESNYCNLPLKSDLPVLERMHIRAVHGGTQ